MKDRKIEKLLDDHIEMFKKIREILGIPRQKRIVNAHIQVTRFVGTDHKIEADEVVDITVGLLKKQQSMQALESKRIVCEN